jgi:hypothetical protein
MLRVDGDVTLLQIGLFIDAFTFYPWPLLGLAALVSVLGLGSSSLVHTHIQVIISYIVNRQYQYVCILIALLFYWQGLDGLAALESFCREQ